MTMNRLSTLRTWIFSRQIEQDVARACRAIGRRPVPFVLGLGVVLRLIEYVRNRPFWMDESALWGNIAGKPIADFSEPLRGDQLAPDVFLMAERACASILGESEAHRRDSAMLRRDTWRASYRLPAGSHRCFCSRGWLGASCRRGRRWSRFCCLRFQPT